jgi:hypothetical protein
MIHCSCLCGSVTIQIDEPLEHAPEACHCIQCRKQTGHFLTAVNIRRSALHVSGQDHVKWFQSSEKVQRGFCSECGSTLFWKPTIEGYQWTSVAMGCFDTAVDKPIAKHIYVDQKGAYYQLQDGAPQFKSET